jgi:hypothetical protein
MVRVEMAVPVPGVIVAGEKEHLRELGSAGHESEMGPFEAPPVCTVAVTVTLPDFPSGTLTEVGDAPNETLAGGAAGGVGGAVVAGHVGL